MICCCNRECGVCKLAVFFQLVPMNTIEQQYSAEGIVFDDGKVLLINIKNLEGKTVWTFPKGHLERGETPGQAAVREVLEETGYACEITGYIDETRYRFHDGDKLVEKTVKWFTMRSLSKNTSRDKVILDIKWVEREKVPESLSYPLDKELLHKAIQVK